MSSLDDFFELLEQGAAKLGKKEWDELMKTLDHNRKEAEREYRALMKDPTEEEILEAAAWLFEQEAFSFSEVLIELPFGSYFRREEWPKDSYIKIVDLVTEDDGVFQMIMLITGDSFQKYIPTDEDLLSHDWVEVVLEEEEDE